jgi:hypothetical protein
MNIKAPRKAGLDVAQLMTLAVEGLAPMFDAESQLFCHRLQQSDAGLTRDRLSPRYTIMTLLGLIRSEKAGLASALPVKTILNRLLEDTAWINNVGDLGLMLWLCAAACPERLSEMCAAWDVQSALVRFGETRYKRTTELAWFLTGLAHMSLASRSGSLAAPDMATKVYRLLRENQGDSGTFGHGARMATLSGMVRGHIGSFADQVYPIYALTVFARACGVREAFGAAGKCAEAICRAQGTLGQWWWHYDARAGRVAERYPVYSVHQDGMAPMALFALGDEANFDFTEPIYKGLQWIAGDNEAGYDLRDTDRKVIWRCIYHGSRREVWRNRLRYLAGAGTAPESSDELKVLLECRPYHLGWLLYAFAGRTPSMARADLRPDAVPAITGLVDPEAYAQGFREKRGTSCE